MALLAVVLVLLGFWQLDRADQKREIQLRVEERSQMAPVSLTGTPLEPEQWDFRRAVVTGEYEGRGQVFLDNRVFRGRAGYHVLTPLKIDGSEMRVLINRGWVAWGPDRGQLPEAPAAAGKVHLTGRLRRPQTGFFTLQKQAPDEPAGVWQTLDLERYRTLLGTPVLLLVLELDPNAADAAGLVRRWPEYRDDWIARHEGYAFQWFSLAVALVAIYLIVTLRRRSAGRRSKGTKSSNERDH